MFSALLEFLVYLVLINFYYVLVETVIKMILSNVRSREELYAKLTRLQVYTPYINFPHEVIVAVLKVLFVPAIR